MVVFRKRTQTNMTLGRANNRERLFFLKPIEEHMNMPASVLDSRTSGSTPVGYHDLPWPSAASGTPGPLEPAKALAWCEAPLLGAETGKQGVGRLDTTWSDIFKD